MSLEQFHPLIRQWFASRFGEPTEPQTRGWPPIAAGQNTLIAAPTGSGKTLAAFLVCLDRLLRDWIAGELNDEMQVVYVSPLKALSNDIERNLQTPLFEIGQLAEAAGLPGLPIRAAVRTGDTPASQRQSMLRRPPHILVTTPESLYLLLTSEKARERLRTVKTVIVDEIHALARDKRGSHLALTLERLAALCGSPPVRIGLSATQRPIDEIANFLVGSAANACTTGFASESNGTGKASGTPSPLTPHHSPPCTIIDGGHVRHLDLAIETPPSDLSAVCSHEQWGEVYERITQLVNSHRSTLIFVNTRRLAERVSHHLTELLGEDAVASHHGSLSRKIRLSAEQRLKSGELKAIVATASLELGIDIGYIDLVCQIGSPRSIATFLQRIGRSGHSLGATPKGRLFPLTRDELLESMALVRAVRRGTLDRIEIPEQPLDILAQQIIAEVACGEWDEQPLFDLCRRAWPYRNLSREDFDRILEMTSNGVGRGNRRGAYLHRDRINGRLKARRGARLAAITSGGAIPETADYRVITEQDKTLVGTVDEDFAIESLAGDVFLLGNTSWRIRYVRNGEVVVNDAEGAPPSIPFWFGEAPGRTIELSHEISQLREDIADSLERCESTRSQAPAWECNDSPALPAECEAEPRDPLVARRSLATSSSSTSPILWLNSECGVDDRAAEQALHYIEAEVAAIGLVPTKDKIVYERFFDESGGMQLVIHSPLGARINRAWGLALRKRFCRSFDFELQAAADDDGIVLSIGPQHSFPIEQLFKMLRTDNARDLLEQALLAVPMFQVRWRWNVTRALAVLRREGGKKVPPFLQRFRSDDLLAATFPETVGCLENHHGDIEIPDHPLVAQTMHDCLHEAMDLDRWLALLGEVEAGRVELLARDTREPSPFCYELLNANPYAFLDDAPLEERRSRAVATRRTISLDAIDDLAKLDPEAIALVREQAWPLVRDADELHDALMRLVLVLDEELHDWREWLGELIADGRATCVTVARTLRGRDAGSPSEPTTVWIATERWPLIESVYDDAVADPPVSLPAALQQAVERSAGWVELVRGRIQHSGPITESDLSELLGLSIGHVHSALEALEGEGVVIRGKFSFTNHKSEIKNPSEWCERRLLARIHRLTLDGLRRRIQPVEPVDFVRFLVRHHHLHDDGEWGGPVAVREAVAQLQGFEMPAGAWEDGVLKARVDDYDPNWLDQLFMSGEVVWGRLRPRQRDEADGPSMSPLTRIVPISLLLREDMSWLRGDERTTAQSSLRSNAAIVFETLARRGALFFADLRAQTDLLPAHLEEALRELAALGLVTSDSFAAVRAIVGGNRHSRNGRHRTSRNKDRSLSIGRWSIFASATVSTETDKAAGNGKSADDSSDATQADDATRRWCEQLLRRYGVVFRDILARESAAPPWYALAAVFRRMEMRGEVRGGRFISGVAGEQFATDAAVKRLREIRDEPPDGQRITISAADPLNLAGIITSDPRVTATHANSVIIQDGHFLADEECDRESVAWVATKSEPTVALLDKSRK